MMIPPLIRVGPPPPPGELRYPRQSLVVLVARRGWIIGKWDRDGSVLIDDDRGIPMHMRVIDPSTVLCWMPDDGS